MQVFSAFVQIENVSFNEKKKKENIFYTLFGSLVENN